MCVNLKTVAFIALFLTSSASAHSLLVSSSGKYLFTSSNLLEGIEIYRCLGSAPDILLKVDPTEYCEERLMTWHPKDKALSDFVSEDEEAQLRSELEKSRFAQSLIDAQDRLLRNAFSITTEVWDLRNFPGLTDLVARLTGMNEHILEKKRGVLPGNFLNAETIKLAADGATLYYVVGNVLIAFDLWSEVEAFRFQAPDHVISHWCNGDACIRREIHDYAVSPDRQYLLTLAHKHHTSTEVSVLIFDRVSNEIVQDFPFQAIATDFLGFSEDGESLGVKWSGKLHRRNAEELKAPRFYSVNSLLQGEELEVPTPRLRDGLRRSVWGKTHEDESQEDRLMASIYSKIGLRRPHSHMISSDRSTALVFHPGEGAYEVFRLNPH